MMFLLVCVVIGLVFRLTLWNQVFGVKSIQVQGNQYCTDAQVIEASGIQIGDSIFSVDPEKVKTGINSNRYLNFVGIWKHYFPCSVVLTVDEYTPHAKINWAGMLLILGDNGVLLESTADIDLPVHVPEIVGMRVEKAVVGQPISYGVVGQAEAIALLLEAMDLQGISGTIKEVNITLPDSLILVTTDNVQIMLGDDTNLNEKIALAREVLPRLQERGSVKGGVLDCSSGESADYRPPAG